MQSIYGRTADPKGRQLIGAASQQRFKIRDGIPVILAEEGLAGRNRGSKLIYDLTAWSYDAVVTLGDKSA